MNSQDKKLLIIGSLLVLIASSLLLIANVPSIWAPMPLYLVLLAWTISYASVLVMPVIFVFQFMLLRNRPKFGIGVALSCLIFVALNIWWFLRSWNYGIKYQGQVHTTVVALENIIGFGSVLFLSLWGSLKNNKKFIYIANLGLFVLLSWCAFPYLGELP